MSMIPSPRLGFLGGVFLANHLASTDNLTRTIKRQNTYQRKLTIHEKWPTYSKKTTLRGRQTEPGFTTSVMGRIYSYNSRPHTGQNDQGTEHKLKHKLLQCRQSGPCEHRVPILLL